LQFDVELQWGFEVLPALITDVSLGGMFIATNNPLWVGATFTAKVLLGEPLNLHCVVRRVLPGKGMGVLFADVDDGTRQRLEKLIQMVSQ
jgi:hypothetical protein